ncbi:MAG: YafY family transcriptional regulator [Clostridiales bacterium]|nr:YafY family transcriptional regulator [Clostridiales bacterium]
MKFQIMLEILFILLSKRKVSAGELAKKFEVSVRTIYRYIDEMTIAGVPIDVTRGARGGIYISDTFKLPKGFMTREEYARAIEAMLTLNEQMSDPALSSAIEKLSAQVKAERLDLTLSGNILVDSGTWGDERKFSQKLTIVERAVREREALEIDYVSREGEPTHRVILPHLLVYKQNIWYTYAFCNTRSAFRLFKLGRMRTITATGKQFERIPFEREDIPLNFWHTEEDAVDALFEVSPAALAYAEEWLGIENVYEKDGKHYAEATLPCDETLLGKILSAGAGFQVLAPKSLADRVHEEALALAARYTEK